MFEQSQLTLTGPEENLLGMDLAPLRNWNNGKSNISNLLREFAANVDFVSFEALWFQYLIQLLRRFRQLFTRAPGLDSLISH